MDYYGNKVFASVNQISIQSNDLDKFILNCRSRSDDWNDSVSESYLKYTKLVLESSNNLLTLTSKLKDFESRINEERIDSFNENVSNLERELSSI